MSERNPKFIKGLTFIIPNAPVKWAKVFDPDTRFVPEWSVTVILDEEWRTRLKEAGFNIKQDKDGDWFLKASSKCKTRGGKENRPPVIVGPDGEGDKWTEPIGNGSICNVKVFAKYVEVSGKTYLPAYINGMQVVEHVPYANGVKYDSAVKVEF